MRLFATLAGCVVLAVASRAVAGVRAIGRAAQRRRHAEPQRAGTAAGLGQARLLGRVGKPNPAERASWRSDDSQHRRRSARGYVRERRPQHAGRPALHLVGRRSAPTAHDEVFHRQPGCELPASRAHAAAHALAAAFDRPDERRDADCVRGERRAATHLPRRPGAARQRSAAVVAGLFSRAMSPSRTRRRTRARGWCVSTTVSCPISS